MSETEDGREGVKASNVSGLCQEAGIIDLYDSRDTHHFILSNTILVKTICCFP